MSLTSDWKNWCRTCGNLMNFHGSSSKIGSFDKDLLEIVYKFFETRSIKILQDDSVICVKCHRFLKDVVKFSQHCNKIQNMFLEIYLDLKNFGECDVFNVRSHYNLDEIDEISSKKQDFDNQQNKQIPNENDPIESIKIEVQLEDINHDSVEQKWIDEFQLHKTDNASISDYKTITNTMDDINNTLKEDSLSKAKTKTKIRKIIKCFICKLECRRRADYEMHMKKKHPKQEILYSCTECKELHFRSLTGLRIHERIHASGHSKVQKDAFVCDQCGKSCASNAHLGEHLSTHSNDYSYECKKCPKKFKHLYRLRRHEHAKHTGLVFQCDNCGLQFNTKDSILSHMIVHSEHKKYKCNYCGKEYKRRKTLKNHLILHSGMKPYKCPFCDKSFTYGTSCRLHKKRVHPQELAALEASGEVLPFTNLPKLQNLQPR